MLVQCKSSEYKGTFPRFQNHVSDYDDSLTPKEEEELNKIISEYETKTGNEIAVASYSKDLTNENFDDFALKLSNHWGIGSPKKNNGLTIIYSTKLHRMRICTGLETQKILTDSICEKVMNEKILPEFKKKPSNYFGGLKLGLQEFMRLWK